MKEVRASFALLIFIISAHVAFLLPESTASRQITKNFAITTCPGSINNARAQALLPSSKSSIKVVTRAGAAYQNSGAGNLTLTNGSITEKGSPSNSIAILTKANSWTSATTCPTGQIENWFVGGTGDVTSQGVIELVNTGLSEAQVELSSYSESGPSAPQALTIPPATEKRVRIDSLSPGANNVITHVVVKSGRVAAFALDERVKGLKNLGADLLNPISAPSQEVVIPTLPAKLGTNSKIARTLRVMAPGNADGTLSVEVISPNSVIVPFELANIAINAKEVRDISLAGIDVGNSYFALRITSTVPIVAAVKSNVSTPTFKDFSWSSGATRFEKISMNLYGLEPQITFVGDRIRVDIDWRDSRGKSKRFTLKGEEIASWKVPPNTRAISFTNRSGAIGAMSWSTQDGISYLPLITGSVIESSSRPVTDISVIQSRR